MFDIAFTLESSGLIDDEFEYFDDFEYMDDYYASEGVKDFLINIKNKVKDFILGIVKKIRELKDRIKAKFSKKSKSGDAPVPSSKSDPGTALVPVSSNAPVPTKAKSKASSRRELEGPNTPERARLSGSQRKALPGPTEFPAQSGIRPGKGGSLRKIQNLPSGGRIISKARVEDMYDVSAGGYVSHQAEGGRIISKEPPSARRNAKPKKPVANIITKYTNMCRATCSELVGWFLTVENLVENREGKKASHYGIVSDSEKLDNLIEKLKDYEETARGAGEMISPADGAAVIKSLNDSEKQLMGIKDRVVEKLDKLGSNNAMAVKKVADKCMEVAKCIAGAINIIRTAMSD